MRKDLFKRALTLAIPMMIQNGITNAVGLIDNIMVGSLGTEAITAVSVCGQLIFVFNLGIFGAISGPGIYGAQYYGQKNEEGFRSAVRMKFWLAAAVLVVGLLAFIFGGEFLIGLYLKGESADIDPVKTMELAKEYLSVMLWGLPPFAITQVYSSSLRETGASIKPMFAGVASVVVDIVGNALLIFGLLGFPKLEVRGAAIATVLSRFAEFAVILILAYSARKRHTFLNGLFRTLLIPKTQAGQFLKKGMPIFLNELLWAAGTAVLTQIYSARSLDIVAGLNISNALCNLLNVVFIALGNAVGILVGQTLGASEYDKAKKEAFSLMWFTGGISAVLTAALIAMSGVFPQMYDTTELVRGYATNFIIITAAFFPLQGFLNALYFTLRSGGKTLITFLFDSVFTIVFSVSIAYILCEFTVLSIFIVYIIVQALDLIKVVIGSVLIKKGIWISNIVNNPKMSG